VTQKLKALSVRFGSKTKLYANKLGTVVEGTTSQEGIAQTTLVDRLTSKPKLKARVKCLFRGKKGS
jgi:hypothetical protein